MDTLFTVADLTVTAGSRDEPVVERSQPAQNIEEQAPRTLFGLFGFIADWRVPEFNFRKFGVSGPREFVEFITDDRTAKAFCELKRDWTSRQSHFNPTYCCQDVASMVALCEREPLRWAYNRPNPNKSTWGENAHLTRFCIRLQVVRRRLQNIPVGPLHNTDRYFMVQHDLELAQFLYKMDGVHQSFIPQATDIGL